MTEIIIARELSYSYDVSGQPLEALKKIELKINTGEYVALVGANGSGKSTLLKHFNALLTPTRGEVRVGDFCTSERDNLIEIRQICGMVFQNPDNQIVATTVKEDLAFGPENLCLSPPLIRERVSEAMKIAGIESLENKAPHLLSGGEKQLVAIAGVIAMKPRCLLLDEATALLDPLGREMVLDLIKKLNREEGITIIHVTHSMEEAALADRILLLHEGKLKADGPPREVLSNKEILENNGLEAPMAVLLVNKIREAGFPLPPDLIDFNELAEVLCS